MFSLMERIKTNERSSLSENVLSSLVRICMEGPECKNFDAVPAMTLWKDQTKLENVFTKNAIKRKDQQR